MNCIIVDDEPIAREGMQALLKKYKDVTVVAECRSVAELQRALSTQTPDVIFLDIEMPTTSGLDFLRERQNNIHVVITTAYHQHALDGYALDVVDYLVKPISPERIDKTLQKLKEFIAFKNYTGEQSNYIFIKCDKQFEKVYFDDILYVEALRNYVYFHLAQRRLLHYASLSSVLDRLPATLFKRIHKSYIINMQKVEHLSPGFVTIKQTELPYSRNMREALKLALLG
jgi:DNA-binding LytR/AlgR family response regulator